MDLIFYVLAGLVVIGIVLCDAVKRDPTPPDCDHLTSNDERCKALKQRQDAARARMKALGIRSLLDGRKAWANVNPMGHTEPAPAQQDARVLTMRRRAG